MGKTNTNEPPSPVTLAEPAIIDSVTLRLSWSRNNDNDFSMYSIYRSESSVDTTNAPVAIINDQQTTQHEDTNLVTNIKYFYRVFKEGTGYTPAEFRDIQHNRKEEQ